MPFLSSFGITGRECSASVELLSAGKGRNGICWFYGEKEPDNFKVVYEKRTTVLEHISGKRIIGAEHLSAASLLFPNCFFKLNAPQMELPLLDGSAKIWVNELRGALRGVPAEGEGENEIEAGGETSPAKNSIEIKYSIERFGHKFNAKVKIERGARFAEDLEKILNARTFIFEEELPAANLSENLRGCGVLIPKLQGASCGKYEEFRFANEPSYHKILDLLGDLNVYGNLFERNLPKKISIINGGHKIHHQILDNLLCKSQAPSIEKCWAVSRF